MLKLTNGEKNWSKARRNLFHLYWSLWTVYFQSWRNPSALCPCIIRCGLLLLTLSFPVLLILGLQILSRSYLGILLRVFPFVLRQMLKPTEADSLYIPIYEKVFMSFHMQNNSSPDGGYSHQLAFHSLPKVIQEGSQWTDCEISDAINLIYQNIQKLESYLSFAVSLSYFLHQINCLHY